MNLTLSFRDEAEEESLDRFFNRSLGQMRFALILGIVLYAAFGLLDTIAAPAAKTPMWIIRYAIVCLLLALGWALSYAPYFRHYWQLKALRTVEPLYDAFYGMREFIARDVNRFWITFGQEIKDGNRSGSPARSQSSDRSKP